MNEKKQLKTNINIVKIIAVKLDKILVILKALNLPTKKHNIYFRIRPPSKGYIVIILNKKIKIFTYINSLFTPNITNNIINIKLTIGPASATASFFTFNKLALPYFLL